MNKPDRSPTTRRRAQRQPVPAVRPQPSGAWRRVLLAAVLAGLVFGVVIAVMGGHEHAASAAAPEPGPTASPSATAAPVLRIWESFRARPWTHPSIPNCSCAGYGYGDLPLPSASAAALVLAVDDLGAVADDERDDTAAIAGALARAAAAGGGTVRLGAGRYLVDGILRLDRDGVVLSGAGSARTSLVFRRPLAEVVEPRGSQWSWRGGLVWVGPGDDAPRLPADPGAILLGGPAAEGDRVVAVGAETAAWAAARIGGLVTLTWRGDWSLLRHIAGSAAFDTYDWAAWGTVADGRAEWTWTNEISAVQDGKITLRKPLRLPVKAPWKVSLSPARGVSQCGVRGLALRMPVHERPGHLKDPGFNAIYLSDAHHCWIEDVAIENADNGIILDGSTNNSIRGLAMRGASAHHGLSFRAGSHDNLLRGFDIACQVMHGLSVQDLASGNVWCEGSMAHGTFDTHRGMPFDNIRSDIRLCSDGRPGGADDAGPFCGRRMVNWNITVLPGADGKPSKGDVWVASPDILPSGAIVGLQGCGLVPAKKPWALPAGPLGCVSEAIGWRPEPGNLYDAQRAVAEPAP